MELLSDDAIHSSNVVESCTDAVNSFSSEDAVLVQEVFRSHSVSPSVTNKAGRIGIWPSTFKSSSKL